MKTENTKLKMINKNIVVSRHYYILSILFSILSVVYFTKYFLYQQAGKINAMSCQLHYTSSHVYLLTSAGSRLYQDVVKLFMAFVREGFK